MRAETMVRLLLTSTLAACAILTAAPGNARVVREYYPSGTIMAEVNLKNFTPDGPSKTYYENGTLMSESFYRDGKQEGTARDFFEDGSLKSAVIYKDGKPVEKKVYHRGGKIKEVWDYTAATSPDDTARVKYYDPQGTYLREKIIKKKKKDKSKAATAR